MRPRTPLTISLFLCAGIIALIWVFSDRQSRVNDYQHLISSGKVISARVLGSNHVGRRTPRYQVRYDYQVGDTAYEQFAQIDDVEYRSLNVGDRIPVHYSLSNPLLSTWKPADQIRTQRIEQVLSVLGAFALGVWLAFVIRSGVRHGWLSDEG